MTDVQDSPTTTETQPAPAEARAGAASGASSRSESNINVTVNVQAPRAPAPAAGGAGHRRRTSPPPAPRQTMTSPTQSQNPSSGPVISNGPRITNGANGVTVTNSFDRDGDRLTVFTDRQGGRVQIETNGRGQTTVNFTDATGVLTTRSNQGGYRQLQVTSASEAGEPRNFSSMNNVSEGLMDVYGLRGTVSCNTLNEHKNVLGSSRSVQATDAVIDSVTRNEVQEFLNRHPGIREQLRGISTPLAELNDRPVNAAEILSVTPNFSACPVARTDLTVERYR